MKNLLPAPRVDSRTGLLYSLANLTDTVPGHGEPIVEWLRGVMLLAAEASDLISLDWRVLEGRMLADSRVFRNPAGEPLVYALDARDDAGKAVVSLDGKPLGRAGGGDVQTCMTVADMWEMEGALYPDHEPGSDHEALDDAAAEAIRKRFAARVGKETP